jgi:hypothetical protein
MIPRRTVVVALALLAPCGLSGALAQEGISRTVRIVTEPAADICELRGSELSCLARGPAELQLEFRSAASARRLYAVRVGYQRTQLTVRPDDTEVRATLRERPLTVTTRRDASAAERQVAALVNERLRALFFRRDPPEGLHGFDFIGQVEVAPGASGRFEVVVPVMIEDQFRVKQLGAIERGAAPAERPARVARGLWDGYVGALAGAIRTALGADARIGSVTVAASYSRTRYALVDDDSTFTMTTKAWVGSRTERYGDVVQRVDTYRVSTFQLPTGYQRLAATRRIYVAVFVLPAGRRGGAPGFEDAVVLSNDNPAGKLVELK